MRLVPVIRTAPIELHVTEFTTSSASRLDNHHSPLKNESSTTSDSTVLTLELTFTLSEPHHVRSRRFLSLLPRPAGHGRLRGCLGRMAYPLTSQLQPTSTAEEHGVLELGFEEGRILEMRGDEGRSDCSLPDHPARTLPRGTTASHPYPPYPIQEHHRISARLGRISEFPWDRQAHAHLVGRSPPSSDYLESKANCEAGRGVDQERI